MKLDNFDTLVSLQGNAMTAENHGDFAVNKIVKLINDSNAAITFNFNASIDADTNYQGLATCNSLLTELIADYVAHCALVGDTPCHTEADTANEDVTALAASTLAAMMASANSLKAKYNAHDVETGTYHAAAGTAHQVTSANATTLPTLITLLNEIKSDYEAHRADDDCHGLVDTTNVILTTDAYSGAITLAAGESILDVDLPCTTLYYKAASDTKAFRAWGLR